MTDGKTSPERGNEQNEISKMREFLEVVNNTPAVRIALYLLVFLLGVTLLGMLIQMTFKGIDNILKRFQK